MGEYKAKKSKVKKYLQIKVNKGETRNLKEKKGEEMRKEGRSTETRRNEKGRKRGGTKKKERRKW
jgi:hypothetical protein